jgi:carbamoyl-phosphate synthase small subunit
MNIAAPLALDLGPDRLGNHLLLASGLLLLVVAGVGSLRVAWVRRAQRQEEGLADLPSPPENTGSVLAAPLRGIYLGTVDAGHWLEWMAGRGPGGRASGYVTVYEGGVQVDRAGTAFWIPREAVRGARLERAHAGKVAASPGRLVVIAWSHGEHELETGFRAEDRSRQPKIVRAVHALIGPGPAYPVDGEITSPRPVPRGRLRLRGRADDFPEWSPETPNPWPAGPDDEFGAPPTPGVPAPPGASGATTAPIPMMSRPARPYVEGAQRTATGPHHAVRPATGPKSARPYPSALPEAAVPPTGPNATAPPADSGASPRGPGTSPRGPGTSPRGPGTSPRGPGTSPRGPKAVRSSLSAPPEAREGTLPAEVVDPLTSPLGDVVRRMREDR